MAKKTIGLLTGGGDVPGLNPCMKEVVLRSLANDYRVIGIRRGWGGFIHFDFDEPSTREYYTRELHAEDVRTIDRTGGTFLHTSRTNPQKVKANAVPDHLKDSSLGKPIDDKGTMDYTEHVLKVLEHLGIDTLVTIGGDDTLSYSARLHKEGVPVVAIPKTMDNDVFAAVHMNELVWLNCSVGILVKPVFLPGIYPMLTGLLFQKLNSIWIR